MRNIAIGLACGGLIFAAVGVAAPASAGRSSCDHKRLPAASAVECSDAAPAATPDMRDLSAQKKRPRITIYPRYVYPGPYAKRQCYSWLATEYRVSGPVITPQMRCWWQ